MSGLDGLGWPNPEDEPRTEQCAVAGELVRIPVLLWAEIAGKRVEIVCETTVRIGQGHCPELAREIFARPMAKTLADISIKTGWEICDPNARAMPPATESDHGK